MTEELVTLETAKLLKEKGFLQRKYLIDISPLEPCDAPKMRKYRPKDDRCTNKQIAKRRKRNKNRKTHGGYGFIAPICRDILKKEIVDKISIEVNIKDK